MISIYLWIALATVLLALFCRFHWRRRHLYDLMNQLPGEKPLPFIGNGLQLIGGGQKLVTRFKQYYSQYGLNFRLWLGWIPIVVVGNPEDLQVLLSHPMAMHKGVQTQLVCKDAFGDGILIAHPAKWKPRRKIITQTFSKPILDSFQPVFVQNSNILVQCLSQYLNKPAGSFNILPLLSRTSLDIICSTAMGVKTSSQTKESEFLKACETGLEVGGYRAFKLWLWPDFTFFLSSVGKRFKKAIQTMHAFAEFVIQDKKRLRARRMSLKEFDIGGRKRKAFLDYLMDFNEKEHMFNDLDLRDEVCTFAMAGFETTSTTVAFALLMIAMHPNVQQNCYNEIYDIVGSSDQDITVEDIQKMVYLEMVMKESLRLFPSIVAFPRSVMADIKLATFTIPKGSQAMIWPMITHRAPEIWDEPDTFRPERFTPEEAAKRHPYSFMPFSAGPRNCVGMKYAFQSIKTQISTILRHYELSTNIKMEDIVLEFNVALRTTIGFPIKIVPRNTKRGSNKL